MRADPSEQAFAQYLLDLGDGKLPTDNNDLIDLPEQCIIKGNKNYKIVTVKHLKRKEV